MRLPQHTASFDSPRPGQVISLSNCGLEEWSTALRRLQRSGQRVLSVLHLFAGERRRGDIEEYIGELVRNKDYAVAVCSVDLAVDSRWDLADPVVFAEMCVRSQSKA